ncbi:hypothetical protein ABW20_dc0101876 [Dactylellina cionopaga]|nr:hypothetical protein ABW20_dc0101876 [Dactylellina cionopaga]
MVEPVEEFFDENSFRESFRAANESGSRLYVRPDEPLDKSTGGQSFRSAFGERSQGSKLYVRPDNSEAVSEPLLNTQETVTQTDSWSQFLKEEPEERPNSTQDEIFRIIFGDRSEAPPPEIVESQDEVVIGRFIEDLTSQESETLARVPLAPKDTSTSRSPPTLASMEASTTPPFPPLRPVDAGSETMSSFTLEASQQPPASHPAAIEMPPPVFQLRRFPRIDTTPPERVDPITPTIKPAASPALPMPSPFPSSALEKGSTLFFPSQLSQSFTNSTPEEPLSKAEFEESETLDVTPATTKIVLEQLEYSAQVVEDVKGDDEVESSGGIGGSESTEERLEVKRETITVVEHATSPVFTDKSDEDLAVTAEDSILHKGGFGSETAQASTRLPSKTPEIIEILSSDDEEEEEEEEDEDEEEGYEEEGVEEEYEEEYDDEEEEEYEETDDYGKGEGQSEEGDTRYETEGGQQSLRMTDDVGTPDEDSDDDRYDGDQRIKNDIEYAEMEGAIS